MTNKNDGFWSLVMPGVVTRCKWDVGFMEKCAKQGFEKGLKARVRRMSDEEFNLFLAQVVMEASAKQFMGVDLTGQIQVLRELRS